MINTFGRDGFGQSFPTIPQKDNYTPEEVSRFVGEHRHQVSMELAMSSHLTPQMHTAAHLSNIISQQQARIEELERESKIVKNTFNQPLTKGKENEPI